MRSANRIAVRSASLPLLADEIVEFHAARLLLLLDLCGVSGRIDGLTKMAKLDFFARYPDFFAVARRAVDSEAKIEEQGADDRAVEAAMVRHHYGPWDKRYYHVLASLESKGLISVTKHGNAYRLALTEQGKGIAKVLERKDSFASLVARMKDVKKMFGKKSGATLKKLIYRLFDEEVARKPMGQVIK